MNKMVDSFNSLIILASMLGGSIIVSPPAMAETCMTESLMMVYEPVETPKPRVKKTAHKIAHAKQKVKPNSVATTSENLTVKTSSKSDTKDTESLARSKSVQPSKQPT